MRYSPFWDYNVGMAKKSTYDPSGIRGISIYHDDKRTIYSPFYSKKGYIMNENNTRHYVNYILGYVTSMVAFEIALILSKSTPLSLLAAFVVLIINFIFFNRNFLQKAAVIENYSKEKKDGFITRQAKELEYDRIYTLIVCCILLVVIFAFYAKWQYLEGIYLYIVILSIIMSALYGFINLAILINKRKMDRKH